MVLGAAASGLLFSGLLNLFGYFFGKTLAGSSGGMRVAVAISVAYLITGLHYVLRDLCRPPISQPSYVRQGTSSFAGMVIAGLVWLSGAVFILHFGRGRGRQSLDALFSLALFGVLIGTALLLI
jgi:hypothetical protein